jgi:MYXO-CTERM domain-containing protein
VLFGLASVVLARGAHAETDKPRFILLLDNSTSMTENLGSPALQTHGDGSQGQPGCDVDGKSTAGWAYDDSKLFLAKSAVIDTISAFGAAEFALATYSRTLLGQACTGDSQCAALVAGAVCVAVPGTGGTQKYCAQHGSDNYLECSTGTGCVRCANPADTNDLLFDWGAFDCTLTRCSFAQGCVGGQIAVPFPAAGGSNLIDIYHWIDGVEDSPPFSATSNRELRAVTMTPIGSALDSLRAWLTDASQSAVGPGAGLLSNTTAARDPRAACRPYNIILITDGEDTCSPSASDPITAAAAAFKLGIHVYVIGFGVANKTSLNSIAMAGSGDTRPAYFAANRSDLIASLGDILMNSMPKPRCVCGASCYNEADAFPQKGQPCTVGIGRCKRAGVYACNGAGDGVVCATSAACGATPLVPGTPVPEQCGELPGCQAPTDADCADENCDGVIDEGLSCACLSKPEVCNGLDDNCDGIVDNIAPTPCGLDLGACTPGVSVCAADGAGGYQVVCQGGVAATPEVCDGIDNDCNGLVDDLSRPCYPEGVTQCTYDAAAKAWACVGACQTGRQACAAGAWQACVGAVTPVPEIACDGLDNNCDGVVDENNPAPVAGCYPAGVPGCDVTTGKCIGECALGHPACAANKLGLTCAGTQIPTTELCNGKDDDCDGQVDEDFPTLGQPCNLQSCQGAGQIVCTASGTGVECSVSAAGPTPEVCDGRDNDCDGQIDEAPGPGEPPMPGVGVSCGSSVGECRPGLSACVAGKIVCNAVVGPGAEICDGLDNDCNGSIDDGVTVPGASCNPAGMAPGQPMVGECRPGSFVCRGHDGWKCQGGIGPAPEVCDGKDNDCDGVIDNNASCAPGYVCVEGECVQACIESGESYPCSADRYCKNGACLVKACARQPCPAGLLCQPDGSCVDPCSLVTCLAGAKCVNGVCLDCYTQGCSAGQRCIERTCRPDPCATTSCPNGQFCYGGSCMLSCSGVSCGTGRVCKQGSCSQSSCTSVCASDFFCDEPTGTCRPKPCSSIACPSGQVCVNTTGLCTNDPCEQVRCGANQVCVVSDEGRPDCVVPTALVSGVPRSASTAGSGILGCSCTLGQAASSGAGAWLALVVGLALAVGRRRRRR